MSDSNSTEQAKKIEGFAIVIGSSLPDLFHDSSIGTNLLWKTLDKLLDPKNPNAIAILAHNAETSIETPPPSVLQETKDGHSSFECFKQISGLVYGMRTIYKQDHSDFLISLCRRRKATHEN
eukprot:10620953-Ditylum_brightwellii.AAC.1